MSQSTEQRNKITKYTRLTIYSYLHTEDLLFKIALLNKSERENIKYSRIIGEKTVKVVIKPSCLSLPCPLYIFDFSDKLIIQSVSALKQRTQVLNYLMEQVPDKLSDFKIKLQINELSVDLINTVIKREIKFQDLNIYHVATEYTDKVDSFLKSSRNLKIYESNFRQIFPKPVTNTLENSIESLHMESVDFKVKNSIFKNDTLKSLSLQQTKLNPSDLSEIRSNNIESLNIDSFTIGNQQILENMKELISRQIDLSKLSISDNKIEIDQLKLLIQSMPQTNKFSFTANASYYIEDLIDLGIMEKSKEAYIGCDWLRRRSDTNYMQHADLSSFSYSNHKVQIEQISSYMKILVNTRESGNELRIVCRK